MELINKLFKFQNSTQHQVSEESYRILFQLHTKLSNTQTIKPKIICLRNIDEIVRLRNYRSIQPEFRIRIESWNVRRKVFAFTLHSGRNVTIHFIFNIDDLSFNFIEMYEKMFIWLSFLDSHSKLECSRTINVYIFLTDFSKFIPSTVGDELDKVNVNTAFTYSCRQRNEIFIYRKEELLKVFIHESFHSFGLDFSDCNQKYANLIIKNKFTAIGNKEDYNIYESYCETWAQIINILVVTSYINRNIEYTEWKTVINKLLFYEIRWSIFQLSKILWHYGFEYKELFKKNNVVYCESKTSVFSYFFLRAIAMVNLDKFLKWSNSNNRNIVYFKNTIANVSSYCNFLCNNSQNSLLTRSLTTTRHYLSSLIIYDDNVLSKLLSPEGTRRNILLHSAYSPFPKNFSETSVPWWTNERAAIKTLRMSFFG